MQFRFKQFSISQATTAMKVGTDGVLLGAWARHSGEHILDIGTGTGLIALMMAQRFQEAKIHAIEINELAAQEAELNTSSSPWSERITVHHLSLQEYKPIVQYDSIVCNPPFFVESTKAPNTERTIARHTEFLPFEDLIHFTLQYLAPNGKCSIILPSTEGKHFIELGLKQGLCLNRTTSVYASPKKPVKRILMEFGLKQKKLLEDELIIESGTRHEYSKDYITLTKDFYLKM